MNSTIEDLENKIRSLEESNTFLKAKIDENERKFKQIFDNHERKFKQIEDKLKRDRYMLLVGSIGYNFIDSLTQFVFGRKRLIELRPKLRTVDAIRREKKTEKEEERWKTYQDYWSGYEDYVDTYEEYLHKFTTGRVELAHPTSINEDDEEVPSPYQLEEVLEVSFKNLKKSKKTELMENGKAIIHILDQMTRALGRDILE